MIKRLIKSSEGKKLRIRLTAKITLMVAFTLLFVISIITTYFVNRVSAEYREMQTEEVNILLSVADTSVTHYIDSIKSSATVVVNDIARHNPNREELVEILGSYVKAYPTITSAYMGYPDGSIVMYPLKDLGADFNLTTREWYTGSSKDFGAFKISNVEVGEQGVPTVIMSKAVQNNGTLMGVIAVEISLEELQHHMSDFKLGYDGSMALLDSNGNVLAHKDSSIIGKSNPKVAEDNIDSLTGSTIVYTEEGNKTLTKNAQMKEYNWTLMATYNVGLLRERVLEILKPSVILSILGLIAGISIALLFSWNLRARIRKVLRLINKVSVGDFTFKEEFKGNDELTDIYNQTLHSADAVSSMISVVKESSSSLQDRVKLLNDSVSDINKTVEEVSLAMEQISIVASDQAKNTEVGTEKIIELGESIQTISSYVGYLVSLCDKINNINEDGVKSVDRLVSISKENESLVEELSSTIKESLESYDNVSSILSSINEIASQTNLLSLNASIEAARAGEHGRGFAVVAEEIRKLATSSQAFSDKISEIMKDIKYKSDGSLDKMDTYIKSSTEQVKSIEGVGNSFGEITNIINELTAGIQETKLQNDSLILINDEVALSVENITAGSEETAAQSEEVTASSEEQLSTVETFHESFKELSDLSEKLSNSVSVFKI